MDEMGTPSNVETSPSHVETSPSQVEPLNGKYIYYTSPCITERACSRTQDIIMKLLHCACIDSYGNRSGHLLKLLLSYLLLLVHVDY